MAKARKKIGPRVRFEVFKRDNFTCRYCGRKSPEAIIELEHIVPVSEGGSDDPINLATSCHECNSGKSAKPLSEIMTGEDPHDKAIEILEKERQLREYDQVRRLQEERKAHDWAYLEKRFRARGFEISDRTRPYITSALENFSAFDVAKAFEKAVDKTLGQHPFCVRYFCGIIRNWKENKEEQKPPELTCYWCDRPTGLFSISEQIVYCNERCHLNYREGFLRGDLMGGSL